MNIHNTTLYRNKQFYNASSDLQLVKLLCLPAYFSGCQTYEAVSLQKFIFCLYLTFSFNHILF